MGDQSAVEAPFGVAQGRLLALHKGGVVLMSFEYRLRLSTSGTV